MCACLDPLFATVVKPAERTDVKFEGARSVFQWTGAFPAVLPSEQFVYAGRSGLP